MKGGISSVEFLIDCGYESKRVWGKEGQDLWKNDIILIQFFQYYLTLLISFCGSRHGALYISNDILEYL